MPPKLSPRTKKLVEKIFGSTARDEVIHWLENECGNNLPGCDTSTAKQMERIRFAVLKLSQGNLKKLLQAIDLARTDWRDLFMATDFGFDLTAHEKWAKEILG